MKRAIRILRKHKSKLEENLTILVTIKARELQSKKIVKLTEIIWDLECL